MTTTWTRTAQQIATDALQHLSVIGESETPTSGQMQSALRALNTILKELPQSGLGWPQLSGEVALTFAAAQTMALPSDYYGFPVAWKTASGQKIPLKQIPHALWVQMPDRATTAAAVTHFYISPDKVFYTWPVVAVDPVITLQYQKVISDASATQSTDLLQFWCGPLGWGVASEMALDFGISQPTRVEIAQRWTAKRDKALESSIASEVISMGVKD